MTDYNELHPKSSDFTHAGSKPDGLYIGLPESEYYAEPRFSSSGTKLMRISPRDFWVRSYLNPEREEDEDSDAKMTGSAYHKRILEGRNAFLEMYAPSLDKSEFPAALVTVDDIKTVLRDRGLAVGGNKQALIDRLLEDEPNAQIWDVMVSRHQMANEGRTLLPFGVIKRIEMAAAMIERHPHLSKCFTGGQPEVSIFWHDKETGVPCKARIDYMKIQADIDLKSFSNPLGKPINAAVRSAIANYGYYVQAAMYRRAIMQAIRFIRRGQVFGGDDLHEWLRAIISTDLSARQFVFVFQDTGPAQVARGYIMPRGTVFGIGDTIVTECLLSYRNCIDTFGDTPWVDLSEITTFEDTSFPAWIGSSS